ncbi:MAG: ABC transporter permease [Limisphaerales bacterium]
MNALIQDLRYGLRMLAKNPGFTAVAVLTLALGLGANATIFGMINVFFFEPLPLKDAERLAIVMQKTDVVEFPHGFSWPDFKDLRERVEPFEDALALMLTPANLGADGQSPERTWIEYVSGNYFTMLGVPAALGRTVNAGEGEQPGADPVIVLAHQFWQRKFGGDPSIVGRTIAVNGQPVTVIGVMPQTFSGAQWSIGSSAWVPASMMPQLVESGKELLANREAPAFKMMVRLKPETSPAEARAAAEVALRQLDAEHPRTHRASQVMVVPEMRSRPEPTFSQFMPFAAVVFLSLVMLVLLIACANVANLMFSRALTRRKEMGIRAAVGASRRQLLRQLLVESVLLALLAGAVGSVLAHGFGALISGFAPSGDIPIRTEGSWSWRVFTLTVGLSVVAGLLTGLVPALRATHLDLQTVIKEGAASGGGSTRHPFRSALVIGQTALCVTVLACGGLFLESLRQVARQDLGFRRENMVMASLDLGLQRYSVEQGQRFYQNLIERLSALPGAKSVAIGGHVPFDYSMRLTDVAAEGRVSNDPAAKEGYFSAGYCQVSTNYLRTLGVSLVQGRDFEARDGATAPRVAIVNETLARRLWGEEDPLGKRLRFGRGDDVREVVGVVRNGKYFMLTEEARPFLYTPLAQHYSSPASLHVRTDRHPLLLVPAIRQVLSELDPNLPIYNVRSMDEHLRQSALALMPLRMAALLAGVQGMLGLGLAVMGIYGVVAYVVSQRTREIGIRVALGARPKDVLRLVVREGWTLTLIGMGIGLGLSLLLALGLSRLLYGLNPLNVPVFFGVLLLLAGVALLACYLPARRALRVNPMVALRSE